MERRAEETEARRRRLVEAALDVAATEGLEDLTLAAVAARADVALRTLYNHFPTRDALLAAATAELIRRVRASVGDLAVAPGSPRERLASFVWTYLTAYDEQGRSLATLMRSADLPDVAPVIKDIRGWRKRQLKEIVAAAEREGSLRMAVPDAVAVAYLATAYRTFATLVDDAGIKPAAARDALIEMADRALFA